jgi:hypothetical protein
VETRNHYKRDVSAWQEDRHRHRKPYAALNLALTRNVLLALIPFEPGQPLAHFFEQYHRHPHLATQSEQPLDGPVTHGAGEEIHQKPAQRQGTAQDGVELHRWFLGLDDQKIFLTMQIFCRLLELNPLLKRHHT